MSLFGWIARSGWKKSEATMKQQDFLGIDVGSGSARAGLFTADGKSAGAAMYSDFLSYRAIMA